MNEKLQRTETDILGEKSIPTEALYGIHSLRAKENFPDSTPFSQEWYSALGLVKKSVYLTYQRFTSEVKKQYPHSISPDPSTFRPADAQMADLLPPDSHMTPSHITNSHQPASFPTESLISDKILEALIQAADEIEQGQHFSHFIVPGISGGAGTSINMNINEIIANRALNLLGHSSGSYHLIDPVETANVFQSTNDVIPTALKVAIGLSLKSLENAINQLRAEFEVLEKRHSHHLRIAYTQMQEAVPSSYGKLFSSYAEALSRDWWRVSKCFERIKVVNLGGGAIGTGLSLPRYYIFTVNQVLASLSELPITRGENLVDATCNLDSLVEVHATLKTLAVNLEKITSDIRLLSADLFHHKSVSIPERQVGSSIMPGKINPVITEFVISCAHRIYSHDQLISSLAALGCLELNAYLPVIGISLLESLKLLTTCCQTVKEHMVTQITINPQNSLESLYKSASLTTALIPLIGYHKASELALYMKKNRVDIFTANQQLNFLPPTQLDELTHADNLLKLGYLISDFFPSKSTE